ncbi:MAG: GTPase ObgE [Synergistaceae bacterium]|jgi:GTP-binding protein|nr:GTPase ObgE [Synergistaceae bacterium]
MKFVDLLSISVSGGRGGNGCMSFRREKFIPKGGPDGGNGGRGGDVILEATANLQTLADFEHRRRFAAGNGEHGSGNGKNGRGGESFVLKVPCGTLVFDEETGEGLADLVEEGDRYVAALGGRGGRGNRVFASSQRRAPRFSEKGETGDGSRLKLELRLIADIGFVGLPNAGKSSLLGAVSGATPKIADYPFTTLSPNLGVLFTDTEAVVLADIPGLIEGASSDKGLGLDFLRHIERTRLLLHVLDISARDADAVKGGWRVVRQEMGLYDEKLSERPCMVICNKTDLCADMEDYDGYLDELERFFNGEGFEFCAVSAVTGQNMEALTRSIVAFAAAHPRPRGEARLFASLPVEESPLGGTRKRGRYKAEVIPLPDGSFRVLHPQVERAADRYDLSQDENVARFTKLLRKHRVEELLEAAGAVSGASVSIGGVDFNFSPDYVPGGDADDA